jgi:hypothetical protein
MKAADYIHNQCMMRIWAISRQIRPKKKKKRKNNGWVSGLRPLSRILNTRKHNVSETGSVSVYR